MLQVRKLLWLCIIVIGCTSNRNIKIVKVDGKALPFIKQFSYLQINNIRYNKLLDDYITLDTTKSQYSLLSATKNTRYQILGLPKGLEFISFAIRGNAIFLKTENKLFHCVYNNAKYKFFGIIDLPSSTKLANSEYNLQHISNELGQDVVLRDNSGRNMLLNQYNISTNYWSKDFYSTGPMVGYDGEKENFYNSGIKYPSVFQSKIFGGAIDYVYKVVNGRIVYGFYNSEHIFIKDLNRLNNVTEVQDYGTYKFVCNSFDSAHIGRISAVFDHFVVNDINRNLIVDEKHDLIVQIIWMRTPIAFGNKINTISDKPIIIRVFNSQGEFLAEKHLGNNYVSDRAAIINGDLYMYNSKIKQYEVFNINFDN
jgi:hypothetical protein